MLMQNILRRVKIQISIVYSELVEKRECLSVKCMLEIYVWHDSTSFGGEK